MKQEAINFLSSFFEIKHKKEFEPNGFFMNWRIAYEVQ
jgi:hypothetical protein